MLPFGQKASENTLVYEDIFAFITASKSKSAGIGDCILTAENFTVVM